ncbi:D-lyxose/D-mannose family sugar isomerase [Vallitalea pronyensis]|uniref:D-lyxose ketol-isomerase n=1 Tax=Vallitalea pronyensis TaxID=1348613 RepID=A0A8J8MGH3_9FIRM|nr:D-lyxose/D-mannose family sugar isomerase [Vallitalea pronyensis]QUI21031.1 D-lyxose/D-mannose family sugar isomerase [Vallitalea pronyensis]
MNCQQVTAYQNQALNYLKKAHIVLTPLEIHNIEIVDFGLGNFEEVGLAIVTYVNTSRVCAKELVLLPHQICPEHIHPPYEHEDGHLEPGKEETFRCRYGQVNLYVKSEKEAYGERLHPEGHNHCAHESHEIRLKEGEQYTLLPHTKHWFQAGEKGAVISEFSTQSRDALDIFTDPRIQRIPTMVDEKEGNT